MRTQRPARPTRLSTFVTLTILIILLRVRSERDESVRYLKGYVLAVPANLQRVSLARESIDGESMNEISKPALWGQADFSEPIRRRQSRCRSSKCRRKLHLGGHARNQSHARQTQCCRPRSASLSCVSNNLTSHYQKTPNWRNFCRKVLTSCSWSWLGEG